MICVFYYSPTQVASTVISTALGVAGQAAASAYSTARDVFHTLQAKNKVSIIFILNKDYLTGHVVLTEVIFRLFMHYIQCIQRDRIFSLNSSLH